MNKLEIIEDFKTRFNKALEIRGKKPIDVVKATGISESAISQYRSGLTEPKRERLAKIADYLKVNPTWLLGLDVPMENKKEPRAITDLEFEYVQKIRLLDEHSKEIVLTIIEKEYQRQEETYKRIKVYEEGLRGLTNGEK